MSWENSIFNDDRSPLDSWQNRDSDTHMEIDRSDLMDPPELTQWELDHAGEAMKYFARKREEDEMDDDTDEVIADKQLQDNGNVPKGYPTE
jgi:hypothetical protein